MGEADSSERTKSLLNLVKGLSPEGFEKIATDFRTSRYEFGRGAEYRIILYAWAKIDPQGALDFHSDERAPIRNYAPILASWAEDNPDAALQWAKENTEGRSADAALVGVIQGIAIYDTVRATEILSSISSPFSRIDALEAITPYIVRLGQDNATDWIESIKDEESRGTATTYIAKLLTRQDPESTAAWATTIESTLARESTIKEVAREWAIKDVEAARAWAETLSGNDKGNAISQLIIGYTRENVEQASQLVDSVADSDSYDSIARLFISRTTDSNPELALAKIPAIRNSKSRDSNYIAVLGSWYRKDASASESWMKSNNIPDEIQQRAIARSQRQ